MKNGTTYYSAWDWLPWTVIILTVAVCVLSTISVSLVLALIMTAVFVLIEIAAFLGTYYEISGDDLIVHSSFKVVRYPISEISEIKPTKSWLATPASSLSNRIAIKFNDKRILKSSIPLIISPARQGEFISQLLSINPDIRH